MKTKRGTFLKTKRGKYDRSLDGPQRKAQQRQALLAAATHVFGTVGAREATVEAIVAKARMSRRTFYEHFQDVYDCLAQLHASLADEAWQQLQAVVALSEDPMERIRLGIAGFFAAIATHPVEARVVFREIRVAGPKFEARWELELTRYTSLLLTSLTEAHAKGLLARRPSEESVYVLTTGLEALGIRYVTRGNAERLADTAEPMADLVLQAFGVLNN